MSRRYNVCTPRARKDKTYWHAVGSAFEDEKGVTVYLDSSPYPDAEGRIVLKLFEPRDNGGQQQSRPQNGGGRGYDDGADVPF